MSGKNRDMFDSKGLAKRTHALPPGPPIEPTTAWVHSPAPGQLADIATCGPLGAYAHDAAQRTGAAPMGVLSTTLVFMGAFVGPNVWVNWGDNVQFPLLYVMHVPKFTQPVQGLIYASANKLFYRVAKLLPSGQGPAIACGPLSHDY